MSRNSAVVIRAPTINALIIDPPIITPRGTNPPTTTTPIRPISNPE